MRNLPVEEDCAVLFIHWKESLSLSGESCATETFSGGGCSAADPGGCIWLYSGEQYGTCPGDELLIGAGIVLGGPRLYAPQSSRGAPYEDPQLPADCACVSMFGTWWYPVKSGYCGVETKFWGGRLMLDLLTGPWWYMPLSLSKIYPTYMIWRTKLKVIKNSLKGEAAPFTATSLPRDASKQPSALTVVPIGFQCEIRGSSSLSALSHDVAMLTRW